jgi:hypothetical protein
MNQTKQIIPWNSTKKGKGRTSFSLTDTGSCIIMSQLKHGQFRSYAKSRRMVILASEPNKPSVLLKGEYTGECILQIDRQTDG